jgi:hypothetical protein
MLPVTIIREEGVSCSQFKMFPIRIVIANGVVPIRDPYRSIRADFGDHRSGPGI